MSGDASQLSPEDTGFGPDNICTLDLCPIEYSIYRYRPSLPANITLIALFGVIGVIHTYLGWRWKSWGFMVGMLLGCISEIIGYVGRIMLWDNPFSFNAFMIQIVCLTIAPVFFTASIYVTLSQTINYFAPDLSRFRPSLFYWIFIPADVVCLILQAAGGAMSTDSDGSNQIGVDISMAGLVLQVVVIAAFIAAFADYMLRYWRSGRMTALDWRFKTFFGGLSAAIALILARCAYRVAELREGYDGEIITHEIPFIILEGAAIVAAAACLFFCHPGIVFKTPLPSGAQQQQERKVSDGDDTSGNFMTEPTGAHAV